eukprot:scaffold18819_cov268-Amphora_coffeaeformis.AAC.8
MRMACWEILANARSDGSSTNRGNIEDNALALDTNHDVAEAQNAYGKTAIKVIQIESLELFGGHPASICIIYIERKKTPSLIVGTRAVPSVRSPLRNAIHAAGPSPSASSCMIEPSPHTGRRCKSRCVCSK